MAEGSTDIAAAMSIDTCPSSFLPLLPNILIHQQTHWFYLQDRSRTTAPHCHHFASPSWSKAVQITTTPSTGSCFHPWPLQFIHALAMQIKSNHDLPHLKNCPSLSSQRKTQTLQWPRPCTIWSPHILSAHSLPKVLLQMPPRGHVPNTRHTQGLLPLLFLT